MPQQRGQSLLHHLELAKLLGLDVRGRVSKPVLRFESIGSLDCDAEAELCWARFREQRSGSYSIFCVNPSVKLSDVSSKNSQVRACTD